jgi:hypothetical protein
MIQTQYYSSYPVEQILKLLQFTEMIIFHMLILLMSSQEPIDVHDFKLYENEFYRLIKQDFVDETGETIYVVDGKQRVRCQMPPFYCLDILFKYEMYDEACRYLYYRREFNELLQMIRFEYEENKNLAESLKSKIARLQ